MRMDPLLLKIMVVVFQLEFIKEGVSALEVVMTKIGAGGKLIKIRTRFLEDCMVLVYLL
jgi:hypothetical protein